MVVVLTILVLGALARVDRALDEITSRPPSNARAVLVRDAKDQSPIPPLPAWVVVGATSATAPKSRFEVQGTPYAVVIDGDGRVAAVGIPNKAVDIRRLLEAAERHIILSRPARVDHGAGTQHAAPVR
ncbi:hypothetical protein [Rugosimonospora acidiphila]